MSIKYNLLWPFESGIYFAYTQLSYWKIFDTSSPFKDNNYMPEVFYKFESRRNLFNIFIPGLDYVQISPYSHRSNGRESGPADRGEDKYYGEIQVSKGQVYNFGARGKVFNYYHIANGNKDINDYHKNYEASVFFKLRSRNVKYLDKEEISFSWGGNPLDKGWAMGEISLRILTTYIQPKLYIQWFHGYDEFMLNYDKKTSAVRAGLIF